MPTLEQARAAFALEQVESVKAGPKKGKFKTQLVKLPARLHNNGLGQTVAFYLAAGGDKPEVQICGWLQKWLGAQVYGEAGSGRLIDWITGSHEMMKNGSADPELLYRQASAEARALAGWLKRFAEAFIAGDAVED
jgi:CRISPR-associated protein Cmr5